MPDVLPPILLRLWAAALSTSPDNAARANNVPAIILNGLMDAIDKKPHWPVNIRRRGFFGNLVRPAQLLAIVSAGTSPQAF
jgi:hypothetical protein